MGPSYNVMFQLSSLMKYVELQQRSRKLMETRQKVEKLYKQHALICNLIFFFSSFGCRCDLQKANRGGWVKCDVFFFVFVLCKIVKNYSADKKLQKREKKFLLWTSQSKTERNYRFRLFWFVVRCSKKHEIWGSFAANSLRKVKRNKLGNTLGLKSEMTRLRWDLRIFLSAATFIVQCRSNSNLSDSTETILMPQLRRKIKLCVPVFLKLLGN